MHESTLLPISMGIVQFESLTCLKNENYVYAHWIYSTITYVINLGWSCQVQVTLTLDQSSFCAGITTDLRRKNGRLGISGYSAKFECCISLALSNCCSSICLLVSGNVFPPISCNPSVAADFESVFKRVSPLCSRLSVSCLDAVCIAW